MPHNTRNSSTTNSILDKVDFPTFHAARAVVVTSNIAYSDEPMCVSAAYTYYWNLPKKPPDKSSQLLATLGIAAGYTILVVYCTWRICGLKRQRTSLYVGQTSGVADYITQSNNLGHLVPTITDSVVMRIGCNKGEQFTGKMRTVEDWNRAFYNQPDEISRTNFVRNNLNWDNPGFVIASEDVSATNGVVPATSTSSKQPEGLFVFGRSTNTAFEQKLRSSSATPSGVKPLFNSATHFPMKSAYNNIFKSLPPACTPVNWLLDKEFDAPKSTQNIAWPPRAVTSSVKFVVNLVPPPKLPISRFKKEIMLRQQRKKFLNKTAASTFESQCSDTKGNPHSKKQAEFLTAMATFSNSLPEDTTIQDWNKFVAKNHSILYNNFLSMQNSPRRRCNLSRQVKILTPSERQLLLEGKVFKSDLSSPPANMKAATKAGQRCSNHYHTRSSTAPHKPLLISSTPFSYKLYRFQCWVHQLERQLREDLNLQASTSRRKRKRSDSEAFTNGSNKRLCKPD